MTVENSLELFFFVSIHKDKVKLILLRGLCCRGKEFNILNSSQYLFFIKIVVATTWTG